MEKNQIFNSNLKQAIVNNVVGSLLQNNMIEQSELSSLAVHFGYLFAREDEQIESLFKVSVTGKSFCFALQEGKLMMVNLPDEQYMKIIEDMKKMHPCILDESLPETPLQKGRRERNNKFLSEKGIATADRLMSRWDDDRITILDKELICKRVLAMFPVIQIACDIGKGNYEEGLDYFKPMLKKFGVMNSLNPKEQRIIDGTYSQQDAIDMDWAYESLWALCWCLGLVDDMKEADVCDCDKAIGFVVNCSSFDEFVSKCNLRNKAEILDMLDLYFRYNWAVNESKVNRNASIGNANPSSVIERRRGLEWVVTGGDDWYSMDLQA